MTEIRKTCRFPWADARGPKTVLPVGIQGGSVGRGGGSAGGRGNVGPFNRIFVRRDGFTLLEVLVAFVLLVTTVTVILQLFSSNIKALSVSEDYASAVVRAESKMREILDSEQLSENVWSEASPDGYRFDITVAQTNEARTKDLPLKILEIDVTMSWKKGGKDRSLTLNTMKTVKPQV
jgi:general secretion pathway protein I